MIRFAVAFLCLLFATACVAEDLTVSFLVSNGKHRANIRQLTARFEAEHPGVKVRLIEQVNEAYHQWMKHFEQSDVDVVWWFAGYQLNELARQGRIEAITPLWKKLRLERAFSSAQAAVSLEGEVYGLPLSYYHWGIYYKKSLFARLKLAEPANWDEFLGVCEKLKRQGITPLGLGTRESWTAAAWFSYLNLRLNGLPFHQQLLAGDQSYLDPRVTEVLRKWKQLIDNGYFLSNSEAYDWKGVLPFLYRETVGMYLIGGFMPKNVHVDPEQFDFFRFPVINPAMPIYEEAPMDVLFISRRARHKAAAARFIEFMARPENQAAYNLSQGLIAPNRDAQSKLDRFERKSVALLAAAKGTSQYFDRDSSQQTAADAMRILAAFARDPDVGQTQQRLARLRPPPPAK
ncbi:MAG: ABC transporter substrate-binding protein [Pseudomonadota bacterium]